MIMNYLVAKFGWVIDVKKTNDMKHLQDESNMMACWWDEGIVMVGSQLFAKFLTGMM